jgi:hypothetical protein
VPVYASCPRIIIKNFPFCLDILMITLVLVPFLRVGFCRRGETIVAKRGRYQSEGIESKK